VTGELRDGVELPRAQQGIRIPRQPSPGVNLVGFLEAESGLGEFARRLAHALGSTDIPVAAIPYRGTHARREHALPFAAAEEAAYDVNLLSLSADDLVKFAAVAGVELFANRYSIGVWFWETNILRDEDRAATRYLDELWVASDYVRSAIAPVVDIPVRVIPVPVEAPADPVRERAGLGLPDGFMFLFVFDFWSGPRKNPVAVVEAFKRAFAPGEGPVLVLKSINGRDWKPRQLEHLTLLSDGRDDIVLRDGYVSSAERDEYLATCDCYVSLHRSEGLGLTMAEAMALGKPVIATGYSGNLEFMNEANSYLVPYELVDVPTDWWAYEPGATWAEPDVDAAATLMRHAWERLAEALAVGERGRAELLERFSPERTARFVAGRLAELRAQGAIAARASENDARPAILEVSQDLAKEPGAALAKGRSAPTSLVRRFLRQALWPYLEEERRADRAVLDAVTSLQRSIQDLERRVLQLEGIIAPGTVCSSQAGRHHASASPEDEA